MRFKKPIFILAIAVILLTSATPQVFSQAQTATTQAPPQHCFKQDECSQGIFKNSFAVESNDCAQYKPYNYNCISNPPPYKLSVPFGDKTEISGLQNYIVALYKFLIGAAGLLAGIMITIAGFEWLTAAGDSGKIKHARERMIKALLGLVLVLGSYTILYTINPALISLQLIPIKMIRPEALASQVADGCKVGRDDALCAAKTPGAKCIAWQEASPDCTGWIIGATGGVAIAAGTACLAVPGVQPFCLATLRAGGQVILKSGKFLLRTKLGRTILYVGAGTLVAHQLGLIGNTTAEEADGICVEPDRQGTKRPGEQCSKGTECASGQCSNLTLCSPLAGVCTDGKRGSPCRVGETSDPKWKCDAGLNCITIRTSSGVSSYQFGTCSDGGWGARCANSGSECADGTWCGVAGVCIKNKTAPNPVDGAPCKTSYDCYGDQNVSSIGTAKCAIQRADGQIVYTDTTMLSGDQANSEGTCTTRSEGSACTQNVGRGGVSGCQPGNSCVSFKTTSSALAILRCAPTLTILNPCETQSDCGAGLQCAFTPQSIIAQIVGAETSTSITEEQRQALRNLWANMYTLENGSTYISSGICLKTPSQQCSDSLECSSQTCTNNRCQ